MKFETFLKSKSAWPGLDWMVFVRFGGASSEKTKHIWMDGWMDGRTHLLSSLTFFLLLLTFRSVPFLTCVNKSPYAGRVMYLSLYTFFTLD